MAVATALGWSDLGQIGLAVGLAFLFGYTLTSIPLFRAGLSFAAALPSSSHRHGLDRRS